MSAESSEVEVGTAVFDDAIDLASTVTNTFPDTPTTTTTTTTVPTTTTTTPAAPAPTPAPSRPRPPPPSSADQLALTR